VQKEHDVQDTDGRTPAITSSTTGDGVCPRDHESVTMGRLKCVQCKRIQVGQTVKLLGRTQINCEELK
jgi:hypothetical protein